MSPALSVARHEHAGRLEPVRLGLRYGDQVPTPRSADGVAESLSFAEGRLQAGGQRFGPFELRTALDAGDDSAAVDVVVRNVSDAPLHVEALVIGLGWSGVEAAGTRFLRHGWQSWSQTAGRALDEAGAPAFPSGPWLRGMHHGVGAVPADRAGWHESDLVSVAEDGGGRCCLGGVIERGVGTSLVYWKRDGFGLRLEVEIRTEVPLAPGASFEFERVRFMLGDDPNRLLERYADELGEANEARTGSAFQVGWCSWYQFFHAVTEEDVLRNLEALDRRRGEIPVDVVQLDDGYQHAIGDWLETNAKFPRGLAPLAQEIRAAGFRPGIWTAPFSVVRESRLFAAHPEWLLQQGGSPHRGLLHREWSAGGDVYVLDTSREEVRRHLMRTFAGLRGMGFTYHKLDFLYTVAMQADAADPSLTRAGRLRRGLEAIRDGVGDDAFMLGCGCPQGAAVGLVDGMRVSADTAPHWTIDPGAAIPGIEPTMPSVANAIAGICGRAWMHRRLWQNDPDCLMVRSDGTDLAAAEALTLSGVIAASGGMVMVSDDVAALQTAACDRFREVVAIARDVDAGGATGTARAIDLLGRGATTGLVSQGSASWVAALVNAGDRDTVVEFDLAREIPAPGPLPPRPLLGGPDPEPMAPATGTLRASVAPHAALIVRATGRVDLGVFCDYDGTFAVQDVGSTLAIRHTGDRREALWPRLSSGELDAWAYNMELLDGLDLPEETVEAFLQTVEPMPGGADLIAWCRAFDIPFRILSDGFGRNLDRLQELHGVRFAYDANHLWYDRGRWRLAPGAPDPACGCGTGICKARRIREFRAEHPGAIAVHIGNGRVSDLCGARAADIVFAKDSLAEELAQQGVPFEPFDDLHDVLTALERIRQRIAEGTDAA